MNLSDTVSGRTVTTIQLTETDMGKFARIRYADIDQERFWEKVDKCSLDECWNWLAYLDKDGYGGFNINSVQRKAHRVAYVLANGKLKTSLLVCHSCDNPSCVNPAHLWAGTSRQNIDDMITKNRSLTGTRNPKAKLTENKIRHILKLSQRGMFGIEIARTIGCNRRTVSNILTGKQWSSITGIRYAGKNSSS